MWLEKIYIWQRLEGLDYRQMERTKKTWIKGNIWLISEQLDCTSSDIVVESPHLSSFHIFTEPW